jgi:hypothetical protein
MSDGKSKPFNANHARNRTTVCTQSWPLRLISICAIFITKLTHFAMNSLLPAKTLPTGAPSPLLRQKQRESQLATRSFTLTPVRTDALKIRAPSQCRARL